MEINFITLPFIVSLALISFGIYFMLYKKFIYSVVDPLFIWVITTAFASVLATQVIPDLQDILHFFGCQIALWIGFLIAYNKSSHSLNNTRPFLSCHFSDILILKWTSFFLLIVYISSNIIIGFSKGFAFLSDNPSEAKIANFQQGFGLFRKINWSTGTFVSTAFIYLYIVTKKKLYLTFLSIVAIFYSLDGSKAALSQIAISAGIVLYHPLFSNKQKLLKKMHRYFPLILVLVMSTFFTVLFRENDGIDTAFFAFIRRLLYSADSLLYYYQPVNTDYFKAYSTTDYISVVTNPILGFFRLQQYKEAVGVIMIENLTPPNLIGSSVIVAPNAPFYIEARIYFNFWIGFVFSAFVGYLYASFRKYYFTLRRSSSFYFIFTGSMCHLLSAIIIDINLAVTQAFDLLFFVVPPYIFISLIVKGKIVLCHEANTYKSFYGKN